MRPTLNTWRVIGTCLLLGSGVRVSHAVIEGLSGEPDWAIGIFGSLWPFGLFLVCVAMVRLAGEPFYGDWLDRLLVADAPLWKRVFQKCALAGAVLAFVAGFSVFTALIWETRGSGRFNALLLALVILAAAFAVFVLVLLRTRGKGKRGRDSMD